MPVVEITKGSSKNLVLVRLKIQCALVCLINKVCAKLRGKLIMAGRVRDTIVECMNEARFSSSDEDRSQALQTLATITKISPQNRNLVAQMEGSVAALVSLSKSTSQNAQNLSLSVLFNLSLNPNLKQYLAQEDIISYLTTLILSPHHCKLAASFVCSLAMLDKNKAKFGVAGIIQVTSC